MRAGAMSGATETARRHVRASLRAVLESLAGGQGADSAPARRLSTHDMWGRPIEGEGAREGESSPTPSSPTSTSSTSTTSSATTSSATTCPVPRSSPFFESLDALATEVEAQAWDGAGSTAVYLRVARTLVPSIRASPILARSLMSGGLSARHLAQAMVQGTVDVLLAELSDAENLSSLDSVSAGSLAHLRPVADHFFPFLGFRELARLGRTSRALQRVAGAANLWKQRVVEDFAPFVRRSNAAAVPAAATPAAAATATAVAAAAVAVADATLPIAVAALVHAAPASEASIATREAVAEGARKRPRDAGQSCEEREADCAGAGEGEDDGEVEREREQEESGDVVKRPRGDGMEPRSRRRSGLESVEKAEASSCEAGIESGLSLPQAASSSSSSPPSLPSTSSSASSSETSSSSSTVSSAASSATPLPSSDPRSMRVLFPFLRLQSEQLERRVGESWKRTYARLWESLRQQVRLRELAIFERCVECGRKTAEVHTTYISMSFFRCRRCTECGAVFGREYIQGDTKMFAGAFL